jgi:chorismate mutase
MRRGLSPRAETGLHGRPACPGATWEPLGRSRLQRLVAFLVVCNVLAIVALVSASVGGRVQREPALQLRGIRGATTALNNTAVSIHDAVEELLREMMRRNSIRKQDVTEAIFAVTPDLTAAFAATAARTRVGLDIPLFGTQEVAVDASPARCIRVLLHVQSPLPQHRIGHVYLGGAALLRDQVPGAGGRVTFGSGGGAGDAGKSVLDLVRRRGVLLVGSTGDYPPFTYHCTTRQASVSPDPASPPLCTDGLGWAMVANSSSTNSPTNSSTMQV